MITITLSQKNIEEALTAYIRSFVTVPFTECDINMTAGRGSNGYSAEVNLELSTVDTSTPTPKITSRTTTVEKEESSKFSFKDEPEENKEGTLGAMVTSAKPSKIFSSEDD